MLYDEVDAIEPNGSIHSKLSWSHCLGQYGIHAPSVTMPDCRLAIRLGLMPRQLPSELIPFLDGHCSPTYGVLCYSQDDDDCSLLVGLVARFLLVVLVKAHDVLHVLKVTQQVVQLRVGRDIGISSSGGVRLSTGRLVL